MIMNISNFEIGKTCTFIITFYDKRLLIYVGRSRNNPVDSVKCGRTLITSKLKYSDKKIKILVPIL